ncbi:MAG: XRE family transcriptional regulator [Alcanivoracaceae bacterium]|nr:XRE family transcriptional regulator [Alcanivoracaceae bacterium]MEE2870239.1 RodZ domain-containing protein [Pseudomonadota bacterium]|tara:strand:+ start:8452 stop:9312 length:861 start_codon:yes stop_codon:yes gene_type:complete
MSEDMVVLPGERCRKAREAMGWTPAEAAKRMHLSQTYLLALEADDYERLPEATFVKGYLKNYARLLGLPADEVANTFQQMVNEDAFNKPLELPSMPLKRGLLSRPWVWIVLVLLVVVIGLLAWPEGREDAAVVEESTQQEPLASQASDDEAAELTDSVDDRSGAEADQVFPEGSEEMLPVDEPVEPAQPEPEAEVGTVAPSMLADNGLDRLILAFSANCWVQITDASGRTLRQGEQQAGASLQLDGQAPFNVTLGNAGAVSDIHLNGEAVTLPTDSPGKVVRITLP